MTLQIVGGLHTICRKPKEKKTEVSKEEGILAPDCLQPRAATPSLPWVSIPPACPAHFTLARAHNCTSQFLKILYFAVYYAHFFAKIFEGKIST